MKKNKGQTFLEYMILISLVAAAIVAMGPGFKRSIQAVVKVTADQLQPHENAMQVVDEKSGYLVSAHTVRRTRKDDLHSERPGGRTNRSYGDILQGRTKTLTNLGFTERQD